MLWMMKIFIISVDSVVGCQIGSEFQNTRIQLELDYLYRTSPVRGRITLMRRVFVIQ